MKVYTQIEDVPEDYLKHLNEMKWPDGREPTDQEKLDAINNLTAFAESIVDMWHGTGVYNRPDYDAAQFREKQIARHAAADRMTPQEFYDEAYAEWMERNGKWHTKQYGIEATEAKCREWATISMHRELETREHWHEYKATRNKEKEAAPAKKRKRIKNNAPA